MGLNGTSIQVFSTWMEVLETWLLFLSDSDHLLNFFGQQNPELVTANSCFTFSDLVTSQNSLSAFHEVGCSITNREPAERDLLAVL